MYIEEYEEQFFEGLERGEPRAKGIKRALDYAQEQQDTDAAFQLYYKFMNEDVMHGNAYQAIILFPEYVAYFEDHPDYQEEYNHDLMWTYKWIIGNISDFYQIPLTQIESIYQQYKDFCKRFNYNLRTYYDGVWGFITPHLGKDGIFCGLTAKQAHDEMMKCKRDELSDCVACETAGELIYMIDMQEDIKDVINKAQPLIDGKLTCAEQPHCAFTNIAEYYLENGDLVHADQFANKAYHLINRDYVNEGNLTSKKSVCMTIFAHTDPNKAVKILKKLMEFIPENSNYNDLFEIYRGSYYFMSQLERKGASQIRLRLPYKDEEILTDDNIYDIPVLKEFFYNKAKEIAEKFDKRNGTDQFMKRLNKTYDVSEENFSYSEEMPDYPVLDYIRENLDDGVLPEEFHLPCPKVDEDGDPFFDGAYDGIMLYHKQPEQTELGELEEIIRKAARGSETSEVKTKQYFEKTGNSMITLVNNVRNYILTNQEVFDPNNMFRYAVNLTVNSNNKECVKLGLCILSLFGDFSDKLVKAILDLAACNEFTLYCTWAVESMDNANDLVFEMAKRADGWGKIVAVDALEPESDEIEEWLLYEGIKNTIHPGYSAITCFRKADVMDLLEKGLTEDNLTAVGMIIVFLILDGPTIGIKAFGEDEEKIMDLFLSAAEKTELSDFDKRSLQLILSSYDNENIRGRIQALGIEPVTENQLEDTAEE